MVGSRASLKVLSKKKNSLSGSFCFIMVSKLLNNNALLVLLGYIAEKDIIVARSASLYAYCMVGYCGIP